jgi:tetratricopeptide (TPR) repeat protein
VPTLVGRRHARVLSLSTLDVESAVALLRSLGVRGGDDVCEAAARAAGLHAKAVELLGTWLVRFHAGDAARHDRLPSLAANAADVSDEERHVLRVLDVFHTALPPEQKDILALATAFRQPPTEARLAEYLVSQPVRRLLHEEHRRAYQPFAERPAWIPAQIDELVDLRLLERVREARLDALVLDTHPLVRRGFEDVLGGPADGAAAHGAAAHGAAAHGAAARAGFLRGRPDRRPPRTLAEAREEVELFHAYCEAGLWSEADGTLAALDNPKHRFLAPAFERDLLLRFFPSGAWTQPPSWPGFGRWRSLAICFEMLGQFDEAIAAYRPQDAALQGDALIALGRLGPLLERANVPHPWQTLWQAYRAHALALAGRNDEALRLAQSTVPLDVYEWVHIFEALLRLGRLDALDLHSMLYRPPLLEEHPWSALARRRMRADYTRIRGGETSLDLAPEYGAILAEYDRAGLPLERVLTRLSYARWLWDTFATCPSPQVDEAGTLQRGALELARRFGMAALEIDALELAADIADRRGRPDPNLRSTIIALRKERGLHGAVRP